MWEVLNLIPENCQKGKMSFGARGAALWPSIRPWLDTSTTRVKINESKPPLLEDFKNCFLKSLLLVYAFLECHSNRKMLILLFVCVISITMEEINGTLNWARLPEQISNIWGSKKSSAKHLLSSPFFLNLCLFQGTLNPCVCNSLTLSSPKCHFPISALASKGPAGPWTLNQKVCCSQPKQHCLEWPMLTPFLQSIKKEHPSTVNL